MFRGLNKSMIDLHASTKGAGACCAPAPRTEGVIRSEGRKKKDEGMDRKKETGGETIEKGEPIPLPQSIIAQFSGKLHSTGGALLP